MKITIFGTGYVGLVTGACFADVGHQVTCVDVDQAKIERLRTGTVPIFEPGLQAMVARNIGEGRLSFTSDGPAAVRFGTLIFNAVGTPPEADGSADLSHVLDVAGTIGANIDAYKVIVNKSTVPVGTADLVADQIAAGAGQARQDGAVRCLLQSGVPEGRKRHRGFHQAGAHHRGNAVRQGAQADARLLCPLQSQP